MKNVFILTKNTLSLFTREVLNKITLIVIMIVVGRFLGSATLGQFSLALIVSQIFFLGTELGLNRLLVREIAKYKGKGAKYLFNFILIRIILGLFTLALIWVFVSVLTYSKEVIYIIFQCAVAYFIISLITLLGAVFQAYERMEYELLFSLLRNIPFILLGTGVLLVGFGLRTLFNVFIIINFLTFVLAALLCLRTTGYRNWNLDFSFIFGYIKKTMPLWLAQLFSIVYLKIASLFLYSMKGGEAVGIYNSAYIMVDAFLIVSGAIATALFPLYSRLYVTDKEELIRTYETNFKFMAFLFLPLAACIMILAHRIIPLIYGAEFTDAIQVLRVLSVASFFVIFSGINSNVLIAMDLLKIMPYICGINLLFNLVFNFSLIPKFTHMGAGIASVLTQIITTIITLIVLKKYFYNLPVRKLLSRSILPTLAIVFFVYLFRESNLFIISLSAIAIYLVADYVFRGFIWENRQAFKLFLREIRQS